MTVAGSVRNAISTREWGQVQPQWFSRPTSDGPGRLNLCYGALDHQVITGGAERPALLTAGGAWSTARTLAEVAAVAGLLRGLGAGLGTTVRADVEDPLTEVLVELAALRLGAVLTDGSLDDGPPGIAVADTEGQARGDAGVWVLRGVPVRDERMQIDWEVGLRAGREDPAPCADVPGDAPAWVRGGDAVPAAVALDDDSALGRRLTTLTAGGALHL